MRYIVECRKKEANGEVTGVAFRGFGAGLPNKKIADKIFDREVTSDKWDAVYMDKLYLNGTLIDVKDWYKK